MTYAEHFNARADNGDGNDAEMDGVRSIALPAVSILNWPRRTSLAYFRRMHDAQISLGDAVHGTFFHCYRLYQQGAGISGGKLAGRERGYAGAFDDRSR